MADRNPEGENSHQLIHPHQKHEKDASKELLTRNRDDEGEEDT